MIGFTAVIAREIQEWKRVFAAALAAGVLVYLAPILPVPAGTGGMETINALSAFMATAFGFGVALLAGGGLIGRDLVERRMTFYFYKPLTEASIWAGKMLAALILAFVSVILTLIPATVVGEGLFNLREQQPLRAFTLLVMAMVALVILGNSLNLAFRARSKWLLLDFVCLFIVAGLLARASLPLGEALAMQLVRTIVMSILVILLLSVLIAGLVGIMRGRIDLREVHKYHAFALWPVMGAAALLTLAFSIWVRSAGPGALHMPEITESASASPWVGVSGAAAWRGDYVTNLLLNIDSGATFRLPGGFIPAQGLTISRDARRAVWFEPTGLEPSRARVVVASLGRKPSPHPTNIFVAPHLAETVLSDDGSCVAILEGPSVTVSDLDSERTLASARIPPREQKNARWDDRMIFISPDVLRIYARSTKTAVRIYEFDIARKKLEHTGTITPPDDFIYGVSSRERVNVRVFASNNVLLYDGRTGKLLAPLMSGGQSMRGFLSDGRVVVATAENQRGTVFLFSGDGVLETKIDLGPATRVRLGGEPEHGKLLVATRTGSPGASSDQRSFREGLTLLMVDLHSRQVRTVGSKLLPLTYQWWYGNELPAPGSTATKIFSDPDHLLVYFDPITGTRRVLAGRATRG